MITLKNQGEPRKELAEQLKADYPDYEEECHLADGTVKLRLKYSVEFTALKNVLISRGLIFQSDFENEIKELSK